MTESRFSELVNLYLDEELGAVERTELSELLKRSPERRKEFESRLRLHEAMRQALWSPEERALARMANEPIKKGKLVKLALIPVGMAASIVMGMLIGTGVLVKSIDQAQMEFLSNFEASEDVYAEAANRSFSVNSDPKEASSVAAHLRLLGLRPGLVEEAPALSAVDLTAHRDAREARLREIHSMTPGFYYSATQPEEGFGIDLSTTSVRQETPANFDYSLATFQLD